MKIKTVFDTNVWISFFIKGKFTELAYMVLDHEVEFYRAIELTKELIEVLGRPKFKKYLECPISEYISFYEDLSQLVTIKPDFKGCRDPKDNYLFDLAYQSNSKYLVSGDRDVRETPITKPLEVVSLTKFKEVIRS